MYFLRSEVGSSEVRRATERNCEMIKMVERGDEAHGRQIFRDKSCKLKGTGEAWT